MVKKLFEIKSKKVNGREFNIIELFDKSTADCSDKLAIIHGKNRITFGDLNRSIEKTAHHFLQKGIRKGDRVMILVPMSIDLYRVVLAVFKIGAVAVFLDEWVSIERLNACCRVAECRAFVGTPKALFLAWFVSGLRKIPIRLGLRRRFSLYTEPVVNSSAGDMALITFTTGSTGLPKAAIRTHGLLRAQFEALEPLINHRPNDVAMTTLPIVLLINLAAGVTSVIAAYNSRKPEAMKPEKIYQEIESMHVKCLLSSPFFIEKLAKYKVKNGLETQSMDKILVGGAPVFPYLARYCNQAFPAAVVQIVYGSTEAEPISSLDSRELLAMRTNDPSATRGLPVGTPHGGTHTKIIEITDGEITVHSENDLNSLEKGPGIIGEIIVSGDHVLRDYLNNEAALRRNKIFIGSHCWHRTGDSGFRDEHGNLFLTGRCSSLIYHGGEILVPFVYEASFQEMEEVEIGTIMLLRNKVTAVVELKRKSNKAVMYQRIAAEFNQISQIVFVKRVPRDPRHHSKIDYDKLRQRVDHQTSASKIPPLR